MKMSDVDISDDDLYSFTDSESENSDFENLANLVEGLGLEPYQFEPTKKVSHENPHQPKGKQNPTQEECFMIKHWENLRVGNTEWCSCEGCKEEKREIDCLCCREVDAITDEQFSGTFFVQSISFNTVLYLNILVSI